MQSSPFFHSGTSVREVMVKLQLATIPALLIYLWMFGWGIIIQILICVLTAMVTEYVMLKLRKRPVRVFLLDNSAMITAVAIAFCLPSTTVWWIGAFATFFALAFGKHLYGGLGYNPFNPAMLGYAVLLISFPAEMSKWIQPLAWSEHLSFLQTVQIIFTGISGTITVDAISMATPLDVAKTIASTGAAVSSEVDYHWALVNVAFAMGGFWLIYARIVTWHIPVAIIGSLAIISTVFHWINPDIYTSASFHLLSGFTMLAAFFIAPDPVSSAATPKGKIIFGVIVGLVIYIIRTWGNYPDAVAFAILFANMLVPLLDQYTRPRVYGHKS